MVLPGPPSRVILGTENGGLEASEDAGVHFAPSNAGFTHRLVLGFASSPVEPGRWLVQLASAEQPLLETEDAGRSWHPLPVWSNGSARAQWFGVPGGWLAAPAEGGLLRYDKSTRQWRPLRFRFPPVEAPRRKKDTPPTERRSSPPRGNSLPVVHDLRLDNTRFVAATSEGLWSGALSEAILRPVGLDASLAEILSLDFEQPPAPEPSTWLASAMALLRADGNGKLWPATLPPEVGRLQWVRCQRFEGQYQQLLGTSRGVVVGSGTAGNWRQLANGLPPIPMLPPWLLPNAWIVAAKSGGIYLSRDSGANWTRVDGPGEGGLFVGAAADGAGFVAATRTEGLLRWTPQP